MSTGLSWKQQRFLADAERGAKSVELIFQDYDVSTKELARWLKSTRFMREIERLRERTSFAFDMNLMNAALLGSQRLVKAVQGGGDRPSAPQLTAASNAMRLFRAVQNAEVRRRGAEAAKALRLHDDSWLGYHPKHTPEKAAALLRRIQREEARANRKEIGQDDDGSWVPAD